MNPISIKLVTDHTTVQVDPSKRLALYVEDSGALVYDTATNMSATEYKRSKPEPDSMDRVLTSDAGYASGAVVFSQISSGFAISKDTNENMSMNIEYVYNVGGKEVQTLDRSVKIPEDLNNGQPIRKARIKVNGVPLDRCSVIVEFETPEPTTDPGVSDVSQESEETFDQLFEDETSSSQEEVSQHDEVKTPSQIASLLAESDSYASAVNSLRREGSEGVLVSEVIEVLDRPSEIPKLVNNMDNDGDGKKLKAALVSHKLRELCSNSQSVDELVWAVNSTPIDPKSPIYDGGDCGQTLNEFTDKIERSENEDDNITVPDYCGLELAVATLVNVDDGNEDIEESDTGFGSEIVDNSDNQNPFEPDDSQSSNSGSQAVSATPGVEEVIEQEDQSESFDYKNFQKQVLDTMVDSENIPEALSKFKDAKDLLMPSSMDKFYLTDKYEGEKRDEYTLDKIIERLEVEERTGSGMSINSLSHLDELDDRFSQHICALIVSDAIRKSSTPRGAKRNLESLQMSKDKIYAGTSSYQMSYVNFSSILTSFDELEEMTQGDGPSEELYFDNVEDVLQSIPKDAGIRKNARNLQHVN